MNNFGSRFPAALAMMAAGVAGFVSLTAGVEIYTSLTRAVMAGGAMFILGKLLAAALFEGPFTPPSKRRKPPAKEKGAE